MALEGGNMPEIALFRGIRITMLFDDHNPPHFHAQYAEYRCSIDILNGCVLAGTLPMRQLKFVLAWAELHKDELMQNWEIAKTMGEGSLVRIQGL
jgi:hypothetical protein